MKIPAHLALLGIATAAGARGARRGRRDELPAWRKEIDDQTWEEILALKPDKFPGRDIDPTTLSIDTQHPCDNAVLTWRDTRGKQQKGYNACFAQIGQREKWLRIRKLETERAEIARDLIQAARKARRGSPAQQAATAAAIIVETGARPGTMEMQGGRLFQARGHDPRFGVTTLRVKHFRYSAKQKVLHLIFIGKAGKDNHYRVFNPELVKAARGLVSLARQRAREAGRPEAEEPVFPRVDEGGVNAVLGRGRTAKDFRTVRGGKTAQKLTPMGKAPTLGPAPSRKQCHALRDEWARTVKPVASALSNAPAQARKSYIDPVLYEEWLGQDDSPCRNHMAKRPNGQPWPDARAWGDDSNLSFRGRALARWDRLRRKK